GGAGRGRRARRRPASGGLPLPRGDPGRPAAPARSGGGGRGGVPPGHRARGQRHGARLPAPAPRGGRVLGPSLRNRAVAEGRRVLAEEEDARVVLELVALVVGERRVVHGEVAGVVV